MEADMVVLLRFVERLLAVSIGGLAVYLGFRLFSMVPESKDSEGRLTLTKDVGIVVSRVGPGVFFALFGALVVGFSLYEGVALKIRSDANGQEVDYAAAGATPPQTEDDTRSDMRVQIRRDITFLNSLPNFMKPDLPAHDRLEFEREIARTKIALMRPVWGKPDEGWGTPEALERWLRDGGHQPPPQSISEAVEFFNYPSKGDRS